MTGLTGLTAAYTITNAPARTGHQILFSSQNNPRHPATGQQIGRCPHKEKPRNELLQHRIRPFCRT